MPRPSTPSKKSSCKKSLKKTLQSSSNTCSPQKSHCARTALAETNKTMVEEEEKLNNLCKLLERLDATYGQSSCNNSPSHNQKISNYTSENSNVNSHSPKLSTANSIVNNISVEASLSQEDKQALRKAKKDAKKSSKQTPLKSSADVSNLNSTDVKTNGEVCALIDSSDIKKSETTTEKSKADLKRERREKQEAQRAAKAVPKTDKILPLKNEETIPKEKSKSEKEIISVKVISKKKECSKSLRHLPLLEHLSTPKVDDSLSIINGSVIHPAIRTAGLSMKDMIVDGCISRVLATLSAIYNLIEDYQKPPSCDLSRDLSNQLSPNISFLNACRPISEPINNAIRFVKREINEVESLIPERQAKEELLKAIETYIHQNIILASETITANALEFIEDNDVILTFGFSTLVYETIKAAARSREKLSVIVADNPGVASGINMLQDLVQLGVKVYYRILPDLPHIIKKVTKVVVEAEAVVLNGAVIGYCGMAGLILLASSNSVPVIVLSHTFKFCNIDLTDSLVVNELGDASVITSRKSSSFKNYLVDWKDTPFLNVVNLIYDVTPPRLINVLVTERNNYPTSVVPVIIKRNYADILGHD